MVIGFGTGKIGYVCIAHEVTGYGHVHVYMSFFSSTFVVFIRWVTGLIFFLSAG